MTFVNNKVMTGKVLRWLFALTPWLGAAVAASFVLLAGTSQGVARDEATYMRVADLYAAWWMDGPRTTSGIIDHFGGKHVTSNNREHPPLMKTAFGLSKELFHTKLGWTTEITSYRLPAAFVFFLLLMVTYWFVCDVCDPKVALLASFFVATCPRIFFHSQLACFDVAVACFWVLTLWLYYRSLGNRWWSVVAGISFGLLLATKHNALLLLPVLAMHNAGYLWRSGQWDQWKDGVLRIFVIAAIGVGLLYAVWPWLWIHPIYGIVDWIGFHLSHVHYNYEYLGTNWNTPPFPWHVALISIFATVPLVIVVGAVVGCLVLVKKRLSAASSDYAPVALLVLSIVGSVGPFCLGRTPIFGGTKHYLAALIPISIFAAIGICFVVRSLWAIPKLGKGLAPVLLATTLVLPVFETAVARNYGLSSYSAVWGGPFGGAACGMNRQFWGNSFRGVIPVLNDWAGKSPTPLRVYAHDADAAWRVYRRGGMLHPNLRLAGKEKVGIKNSDIAVVIHEKHFLRHDILIWQDYATVQPAYVLTHEGVPLVSVYCRSAICQSL